jgi:hypothetical protein
VLWWFLKDCFCSLIQIRMDVKSLKLFCFLSKISRAIFHSFFAFKCILLTCRVQRAVYYQRKHKNKFWFLFILRQWTIHRLNFSTVPLKTLLQV